MPARRKKDNEMDIVPSEGPDVERLCQQVEAYIVQQPVKAMLIAALAGFVFSRIAF